MRDVFVLVAAEFDSGEKFTIMGDSESLCKVWVSYIQTRKWDIVELHSLHNPICQTTLPWFNPKAVLRCP